MDRWRRLHKLRNATCRACGATTGSIIASTMSIQPAHAEVHPAKSPVEERRPYARSPSDLRANEASSAAAPAATGKSQSSGRRLRIVGASRCNRRARVRGSEVGSVVSMSALEDGYSGGPQVRRHSVQRFKIGGGGRLIGARRDQGPEGEGEAAGVPTALLNQHVA